jgi:demethylmenaquinone methyltransferase/2-methoxy-6-polyprenyl-1,4-benzoquinol methylase
MGESDHGSGVYDWWSRHPHLLNAFYSVVFFGREATIRRRSVDALGLGRGDRVLELGSGPGNSLGALRERVGPDGVVVGVDASDGMTRLAAGHVQEEGWENVHVVRGDATRPGVRTGAFDAVYAAMSLTAMPEPLAAVDAARDALRPGGRLVVLDAQPFQHLPWRLLNLVLVPVFERLTNWVPDVDVPAGITERFAETSVETYTDGTLFVASARNASGEESTG